MAKTEKEEDRLYKVIEAQQNQLIRVWGFLSCLCPQVDEQSRELISRFMTREGLGRGLLSKEKDLKNPKGS